MSGGQDEFRVRAAAGLLPEERRAVAGPGLPSCPELHLLPPETPLQLRLEAAQGDLVTKVVQCTCTCSGQVLEREGCK